MSRNYSFSRSTFPQSSGDPEKSEKKRSSSEVADNALPGELASSAEQHTQNTYAI